MKRLNIAIPTYNRPLYLQRVISDIVSAIKHGDVEFDVFVFVIDNSDQSHSRKNLDIVNDFIDDIKISYQKNLYNIGSSNNVLRCFECSDEGYLWIIGDDDIIHVDAFYNIKLIIDTNTSAAFKFSSNLYSEKFDNTSYSIDDLLGDKQDFNNYFSNLLFISSWIFDLDKCSISISDAFIQGSSSLAPQIFLSLSLLDSGCSIHHSDMIIAYSDYPDEKSRWDQVLVHNKILHYLSARLPSVNFIVIRRINNCFFGAGYKSFVKRLIMARLAYGDVYPYRIIRNYSLFAFIGEWVINTTLKVILIAFKNSSFINRLVSSIGCKERI